MGWSAGEVAAYIGAAAWIPHVGRWLYTHVTKPRAVLTGPTAEIGYTTYGPILNLRLNLSCERRDVLVNRISIRLQHQSGNHRVFVWRGTRETFSHLKDASGTAVGSFERDSEATAVKVTTNSVYDSFFRFQELKFIEAKEPLRVALMEHESFLNASGKSVPDELLRSEPMHRIISFDRDAFWWEAGTYELRFEIGALSEITLAKRVALSYEHMLKVDTEGYDKAVPIWRWRNPSVRTDDHMTA